MMNNTINEIKNSLEVIKSRNESEGKEVAGEKKCLNLIRKL